MKLKGRYPFEPNLPSCRLVVYSRREWLSRYKPSKSIANRPKMDRSTPLRDRYPDVPRKVATLGHGLPVGSCHSDASAPAGPIGVCFRRRDDGHYRPRSVGGADPAGGLDAGKNAAQHPGHGRACNAQPVFQPRRRRGTSLGLLRGHGLTAAAGNDPGSYWMRRPCTTSTDRRGG